MIVGIVIIGDEILSGHRQDQHLQWVINTLTQRQHVLGWVRIVGDDECELKQTMIEVLARNQVCFSFGGIGATPDDLTRGCVADAGAVLLERHEQAVANIEQQYGDAAYPHRIRMADLPQGARLIPNPVNNIAGFSFRSLHCLPGFPEMAWPMLEWVLDNEYQQSQSTHILTHSVVVYNTAESEFIPIMELLLATYPGIKVFSLPNIRLQGKSKLELGVKGESTLAVDAFEQLKSALQEGGYNFEILD